MTITGELPASSFNNIFIFLLLGHFDQMSVEVHDERDLNHEVKVFFVFSLI